VASSHMKMSNNRSVMPLDVRGCTRATMIVTESFLHRKVRVISQSLSRQGSGFVIIPCERGIPSKRKSSTCADYVPALCTHRPSLLPIEWFSEVLGLVTRGLLTLSYVLLRRQSNLII
jgi:hypothetical protein